MGEVRIATVTVTPIYSDAQIITVTQAAGAVTNFNKERTGKINNYPNPATNFFQINGIEGIVTLKLTDINGNLLFSKQVTNDESISVSLLPPGMYIVKLITSGGTIERKIMKK
jgi:hypothetical protein